MANVIKPTKFPSASCPSVLMVRSAARLAGRCFAPPREKRRPESKRAAFFWAGRRPISRVSAWAAAWAAAAANRDKLENALFLSDFRVRETHQTVFSLKKVETNRKRQTAINLFVKAAGLLENYKWDGKKKNVFFREKKKKIIRNAKQIIRFLIFFPSGTTNRFIKTLRVHWKRKQTNKQT